MKIIKFLRLALFAFMVGFASTFPILSKEDQIKKHPIENIEEEEEEEEDEDNIIKNKF